MNIERALTITGWMEPEELEWLAEQASYHTRIVEIGCFQGRSTRALAENTTGWVWAIDPWKKRPWDTEAVGDGDWLYEEFRKNMRDLNNVTALQMQSLAAATTFKTPVDMVFIDGNHDYEAVKADILAWRPLLVEGGLLCGHDYGWPDVPGVKQAVDELVPTVKIGKHLIWYAA